VHSGTLNGAPYRIDVPANWNGSVVMVAHGYEPVGVPRADQWPQDPATPIFLAQVMRSLHRVIAVRAGR